MESWWMWGGNEGKSRWSSSWNVSGWEKLGMRVKDPTGAGWAVPDLLGEIQRIQKEPKSGMDEELKSQKLGFD